LTHYVLTHICYVTTMYIIFIFLALFLHLVPVYYNTEHIVNLSNMTPLLSACPHGLTTIAMCSVCSSMAQHLPIISQCTHNWSKLNYDAKFVRNGNCDLAGSGGINGSGVWDSIHQAVNTMGDIAYFCSECHAISCVNCVAL